MQLSERLNTITEMVKPCRIAADIGTDHGFVPIELVERGICESAVASDVGKEPLERAREHIRMTGTADRISCRVGDGLRTLTPGEADAVIIAGMGGLLMCRILTEGKAVLDAAGQLILSPHTDIPEVRKTAVSLGFCIDSEKMLEEEGKYYTVMHFSHGEAAYTGDEYEFGPCLLKERPGIWLEWLTKQREKLGQVIDKLKEAGTDTAGRALLEKEQEAIRIDKILKKG